MMSGDKQVQSAGDNSQLTQAGIINNYYGIDEKRAREICAETYAIARRDFTEDAYKCANERVQQLEESLFPKLQQIEGALNAFADPSFQILLTSAQRTAAATERENDYDMLSELLVCRITKGQARKNRVGISRAIEIIDKIDDEALCALTVAYSVLQATPTSASCKEGLKVLADLFEKLMYMELPSDDVWIEHLDILDAVRVNLVAPFKSTVECYTEGLSGYATAGICINSDNYKKAMNILEEVGLDSGFLVKNELLDGYVRLPVVQKDEIENLKVSQKKVLNGKVTRIKRKVNEKEVTALEEVWDLYSTDEDANRTVISAFMDEWDGYPSLKKLHSWWDSIPVSFNITPVGVALAYTNARRCDKDIPELPLIT